MLRNHKIPISLLLLIGVSIILLFGFDQSSRTHDALDKERVTDMISETVLNCYAIEGSYPKELAYLIERYGLMIDETKYQVHYEWIADNIHPEITVFTKGG